MRRIIALFLLLSSMAAHSQQIERKMSSCIRQLAAQPALSPQRVQATGHVRAMVKITDGDEQLLTKAGCQTLTRIGHIFVADIPIAALRQLAEDERVERIETNWNSRLQLDSTAVHVNVGPAYAGDNLPQAFTGQGVVLGISDIGFDLTHPTFYTADGQTYRISRFLDQFTTKAESFGHPTPLGVEYTTEEEILQKQHSGDATYEMHGTHCLGIAGGSGYDKPYRGMAYEANLCAVASSTGDGVFFSANEVAILKYIYDYADALGQPCVVTYSIGFDDVPGDGILFEEALDSLLGPGHLLVAAAGNENDDTRYFHKRRGESFAGGAITGGLDGAGPTFYIFSNDEFHFTLTNYTGSSSGGTGKDLNTTVMLKSANLPESPIKIGKNLLYYSKQDSVYTFQFTRGSGSSTLGTLGLVIEGNDVEAQVLTAYGTSLRNAPNLNLRLNSVESGHTVMLPGLLKRVVTVGAMSWRRNSYMGIYGTIASFSSQGPTIDYRTKPDVAAPGVDVISALNSFYSGGGGVASSTFNGKTYRWVASSGTSMATPAAAGAVALWLQAKPDLTPEQVLDVIAHASQHPVAQLDYPNNAYGYGHIDAYRGLLYILDLSNKISDLSQQQPQQARIRLSGRRLTVEGIPHPTGQEHLKVYTTDGRLVLVTRSLSADLTTLPQGLYAVQLTTGQASTTGSTLIRL